VGPWRWDPNREPGGASRPGEPTAAAVAPSRRHGRRRVNGWTAGPLKTGLLRVKAGLLTKKSKVAHDASRSRDPAPFGVWRGVKRPPAPRSVCRGSPRHTTRGRRSELTAGAITPSRAK
jgi:hypothetical protein